MIRLDKEEMQKILKEYIETDIGSNEIARKYGIGVSTFNRYRAAANIPAKRTGNKIPTRNIIEDEHYLDVLTKDKMELLAFMFRFASVFRATSRKWVLNIQVKEKDKQEAIRLLSRISNICEDSFALAGTGNTFRARFGTEHLSHRIVELGVKDKLPYFEDNELNEEFYKHHIINSITFSLYEIRIGLGYNKIGGLEDFLISKGVEPETLYMKRGGLQFSDPDSIVTILKLYPELVKKMVDNYNEKEWSTKMSLVYNRVKNED